MTVLGLLGPPRDLPALLSLPVAVRSAGIFRPAELRVASSPHREASPRIYLVFGRPENPFHKRLNIPPAEAATLEKIAENPEDAWVSFSLGEGQGKKNGRVRNLTFALDESRELKNVWVKVAYRHANVGETASAPLNTLNLADLMLAPPEAQETGSRSFGFDFGGTLVPLIVLRRVRYSEGLGGPETFVTQAASESDFDAFLRGDLNKMDKRRFREAQWDRFTNPD